MAPNQPTLKTTLTPSKVVQPFYSGGPGNVALDKSGRFLATVCEDEVVITDMETGQEIVRLEGDGEDLTTLAMTPQATHLIACSRSYIMHIYALDFDLTADPVTVEVERVRQVKQTSPIMVCETDRTGTLVATGGADGIVKVWDIRKGFVTHNLRGHGGLVSALSFFMAEGADPNSVVGRDDPTAEAKKGKGKKATEGLGRFMLASGGDDTTIRIWDLETSVCVNTLQGHASVVRGLDWNEDGSRLLSGARDAAMCLWDTRTWKYVLTPAGEEVESVGFIAPEMFTREDDGPTDKLIFAAGKLNRVRIWDLTEGKELTATDVQEEEDEEKGIMQIIYHKNLKTLVTIHHDYTIQTHALNLPTPHPDSLPTTHHLTANYDEIIDLRFLPPTSSHLAIATNSEDVRIVSSETFEDIHLLRGHTDTILTLDHDWSGTWLATAGKDNDARLWHLAATPAPICAAIFTGHAESIAALALPRATPQDSSHAFAQKSAPKFMLTGGSDRTIKKWDISLGAAKQRAAYTRRAHEKDINAIALSPDDSLFASASQDRTIKIWDTVSGETLGVLRGHRRGVWSVAFSPSATTTASGAKASTLISGSTDKTLKLWNLADYTCLRTFEGHTNSVQRVIYYNAGLQAASAGNDGLVKIWDLKTGEATATLDGHNQRIWALDTTPDDSHLISADAAGIITIWVDTTTDTITAATEKEAELLEQEQQLQNYIAVKDYRAAITLALSLNHPGKLLHLFTAVASAEPEKGSLSGLLAVDDVLATLADSQLATLLTRIRDWNTNGKTAVVAQRVLFVVVRKYGAERLGKLRGCNGVWEVLASYTERHYRRCEELVEESWVVEYTLQEMEALMEVGVEVMEIEN